MTPAAWLTSFPVVLFDMNSTFMFGEDRFGPEADFYATYQLEGGGDLSRDEVSSAVMSCYHAMIRDYEDPNKVDDFPSLQETFVLNSNVAERHIPILSRVFCRHELGRVEVAEADCLQALALHHDLGLVSNIWGTKEVWLEELERAGIRDLWRSMVFSSDSRSMKPSFRLFEQALGECAVGPGRAVMVGDSLRVDIEPAKALGLSTVWVTTSATSHSEADFVVSSIAQLVTS